VRQIRISFRFIVISNYYLAAVLLLVAGILKAIHPGEGELIKALFEKNFVPLAVFIAAVRFQPWFEIGLALLAMVGWYAEWSARVIALIYVAFSGLILYASDGRLTMPLDCGCFGESSGTPVYILLARNTLLALLLFFFNSRDRRWTLWHRFSRCC